MILISKIGVGIGFGQFRAAERYRVRGSARWSSKNYPIHFGLLIESYD